MSPDRGAAAPRQDFLALNGARAVAAYLVIGTHAGFTSGLSLGNSPWAPFLARMRFGVTIFFLLSGFLLSRAFLVDRSRLQRPALGNFWRRRAVRILPAYWLAIVGVLGLLSVHSISALHWICYLLLAQGYSRMPIDSTLSQMWTLSVEISFYAALPLLFWLSARFGTDRRRQASGLVITMGLVAVGANLIVHFVGGRNSIALLWMPLYLDWFALGIALAAVVTWQDAPGRWSVPVLRWSDSTLTCWCVAGLLYWISSLPLAGPRSLLPLTTWEWTLQHELFGAAAFFFLLPLVAGRETWPTRLLGGRVATWFGEISYGVYLWHLGLLLAIQRWLGYRPFAGHFIELYLLTAGAATVVAALSWHLVERPLLRRFSRSGRRPATEPPREDDPHHQQAETLHARAVG